MCIGDGRGGGGAHAAPNWENIFSGNCHVTSGHFPGKFHVKFPNFVNFSAKCHVKLAHFVNFSYVYFWAKMTPSSKVD